MEEQIKKTEEDVQVHEHCEEYLAGWKRAQADYANLKKEMENERRDFAKYANERLLVRLLPAIDQYETALQFIPNIDDVSPEVKKKIDIWFIGIRAVKNMWESAFAEIGLEKISTSEAFDPAVHEAVSVEEMEGKNSGDIIRVTQSGWKLSGKVLRPALVILQK